MLSAETLMILAHERIADLRREAEADRLVQLAQIRASHASPDLQLLAWPLAWTRTNAIPSGVEFQ